MVGVGVVAAAIGWVQYKSGRYRQDRDDAYPKVRFLVGATGEKVGLTRLPHETIQVIYAWYGDHNITTQLQENFNDGLGWEFVLQPRLFGLPVGETDPGHLQALIHVQTISSTKT